MNKLLQNMQKAVLHLIELHKLYKSEYNGITSIDATFFNENNDFLSASLANIDSYDHIYSQSQRQMILADLIEYIYYGRIAINMKKEEQKQEFIKSTLYLVNILMTYENMTVDTTIRNKFMDILKASISQVGEEDGFDELRGHSGEIGIHPKPKELAELNKYFDRILPKTAGGLWHEMLVFVFLLRNDYGHIIPLLLTQRFIGKHSNIVPPDFLIIGRDKRMYGIEVGIKKEIQSGTFSIQSSIPTATIDTLNSRTSDRCPLCKRWIPLCPEMIDKYSDYTYTITNIKISCLQDCQKYTPDQIASGDCPYTKYSRAKAKTLEHSQHPYADSKHYHYKCVLAAVSNSIRIKIIEAKDKTALKTHFPHYSGLGVSSIVYYRAGFMEMTDAVY